MVKKIAIIGFSTNCVTDCLEVSGGILL